MANLAHRVADLDRVGVLSAGEVLLQVGVAERRLAAGSQRERHAQDDVATALGRVEEAGAIGEAALRVAQRFGCERLQIERAHFAMVSETSCP